MYATGTEKREKKNRPRLCAYLLRTHGRAESVARPEPLAILSVALRVVVSKPGRAATDSVVPISGHAGWFRLPERNGGNKK